MRKNTLQFPQYQYYMSKIVRKMKGGFGMNKEILQQIKREYHLLSLNESLDKIENCYKESYILEKIINKYGKGLIEETNNLWFWFLDVSISQYEKIFRKTLEKTDKDRMVSVYLDLENSQRILVISLEEQVAFETKNKVIRGKRTIEDAEDRYFNTRFEYFNLCIHEGQEIAIKTILHEEDCRLEEAKKIRNEKIKKLNDVLKYHLISKDEYEKERQLVLSKK